MQALIGRRGGGEKLAICDGRRTQQPFFHERPFINYISALYNFILISNLFKMGIN